MLNKSYYIHYALPLTPIELACATPMGTHLKIVGWFMTSTRSRVTRNNHNVLTQHLLPHLLCTGLTDPRSPQVLLPDYARVGNDAKRVQVRCAQWMMRVVFSAIRLGPKTSECEKHVSVKSTVTGCDVTNCAPTLQGFNKQIIEPNAFAHFF